MIRGTKRPREETRPAVKADLRASIHNRFDIEVVDAQTGEVKNKAVGYNVICNQLWSKLLSTSWAYFQYIHYGSGSGTPSASDTSLFSFIGAKAIATTTINTNDKVRPVVNFDYENGVYSITHKIVLSTTDAAGATITEVGIGYSNSADSLCTHAMLQDMNGNQISITKTDTDILNIHATVFVRYDATGDGGIHVCPPPEYLAANNYTRYGTDGMFGWLSGDTTSYATILRTYPKYALLQNNMLPVKGIKNGKTWFTARSSALNASFDVANKRLTLTAERFAENYNNIDGGYKYIGIYSTGDVTSGYSEGVGVAWPDFILEAGPGNALEGSSISGEAIGTGDGETVDFKTAFPNAYDCTIFVDGAEASDVIVENKNTMLSGGGYVRNDFMRIRPESTPDNLIFYNDVECCTWETLVVHDEEFHNALTIYFGRESSGRPSPGYVYLYNKNYAEGVSQMAIAIGNSTYSTIVELSNDLVTWTQISSKEAIPEELQHCKFFRLSTKYSSSTGTCPSISNLRRADGFTQNNVHFSTPPALGAVITANYKTPVIAKDANHVYDLTFTIQLGEFNPDA